MDKMPEDDKSKQLPVSDDQDDASQDDDDDGTHEHDDEGLEESRRAYGDGHDMSIHGEGRPYGKK
jgi:hypothetical protein